MYHIRQFLVVLIILSVLRLENSQQYFFLYFPLKCKFFNTNISFFSRETHEEAHDIFFYLIFLLDPKSKHFLSGIANNVFCVHGQHFNY